jgi:tetratricopeptide (TPR) repeat protein
MFDEAISECKKAIALDPMYAKAYFNLGSAYGNKGMMEEAIAKFKQAITINPKYSKAYYSLALAYYSEGNYKLSIEYFDRAKQLGANVNPKIAEQLQPYR